MNVQENRKVYVLNETHQILGYADDINLFSEMSYRKPQDLYQMLVGKII
jgi:hypothetical protein